MRRFGFALLLATILAVPTTARASEHQPAAPHKGQATRITRQMAGALTHQTRIEVTGSTRKGKQQTMSFRVRFQSPSREDYVAKPPSRPGAQTQTLHYIYIGSARYVTLGGRWYRTPSSGTPQVSDLLALNTGGAACCDGRGIRPTERMSYVGTASWHGYHVYVLSYRGASASGASQGKLYVDRSSYLPRGYTATSVPDNVVGTFTFRYGQTFDITAPKV